MQSLDPSHALLFLGKLSRDQLNYTKQKDPTSCDWSSLKALEKAFLTKYPEQENAYRQFMTNESKKWQKLFTDTFKKHSLSLFVFENKQHFSFIY